MWILDSAYRDGGIDLWTKDGTVTKVHYDYNPPFFVHFHDPHAHHEMIEALEERYGAEECTIRTIFGDLPGYAVTAGRDVAEAIERQAQYRGRSLQRGRAPRPAVHGRTRDLSLCRGR